MFNEWKISRRTALAIAASGGAAVVTGDLITASRASAGSAAPHNIQVSRDDFVARAEPCLAVNPRDPRNLLGACIAYREQAGSQLRTIAAYASFDAGETWSNLGALVGSDNGRDPTVTFDRAGRGYICANTNDLHVWRTDDGGRTFAAPVLATRGLKLDHPWLAADPSPGPAARTRLYGAWTGVRNASLEFCRSTDGGDSFEPPRVLDVVSGAEEANFASPMVAAGGGGIIHAVYGVWPPLEPAPLRPEFPAPIRVISSTDGGDTWGEPVRLGISVMEARVTTDTNVPSLPAVVAHYRRPVAAAAFAVRRPGAPVVDIAVCLSRNGGRTWSAPRLLPRTDDETSYTQPQLAIDEAGRLALSVFAYRRGLIDVLLFLAPPGSTPFGRPTVVTSRPFDPTKGTLPGKHGAWWIGDYQGLAATSGRIHPFWNDPRTGRLEIFTATVPTRCLET